MDKKGKAKDVKSAVESIAENSEDKLTIKKTLFYLINKVEELTAEIDKIKYAETESNDKFQNNRDEIDYELRDDTKIARRIANLPRSLNNLLNK